MTHRTAKSQYGIQHRIDCPDFQNLSYKAEPCEVDIITLTDKQERGTEKKTVLIQGSMIGDEVIGSHVAFYFAEYILTIATNGEPL